MDALTGAVVYERPAERRMLRGLGPAPSLLYPSRYQALVGTCGDAQLRRGAALLEVLLAFAFSRTGRDPGDLDQQVGAVAGDLPQLCHPGFLVCGQGVPAGMPPGRPGQLGDGQPVRVGSAVLSCHLTRVEHACASGKCARVDAVVTGSSPSSLGRSREKGEHGPDLIAVSAVN